LGGYDENADNQKAPVRAAEVFYTRDHRGRVWAQPSGFCTAEFNRCRFGAAVVLTYTERENAFDTLINLEKDRLYAEDNDLEDNECIDLTRRLK
jgi:hypothetical protein